jgi:splicing factor 3B subunit 3
MFLYNVPIVEGQVVEHLLVGQFSGTSKAQELLVSRGGDSLELFRFDATQGRLVPIWREPVFGVIRSMVRFRLSGHTKGTI